MVPLIAVIAILLGLCAAVRVDGRDGGPENGYYISCDSEYRECCSRTPISSAPGLRRVGGVRSVSAHSPDSLKSHSRANPGTERNGRGALCSPSGGLVGHGREPAFDGRKNDFVPMERVLQHATVSVSLTRQRCAHVFHNKRPTRTRQLRSSLALGPANRLAA